MILAPHFNTHKSGAAYSNVGRQCGMTGSYDGRRIRGVAIGGGVHDPLLCRSWALSEWCQDVGASCVDVADGDIRDVNVDVDVDVDVVLGSWNLPYLLNFYRVLSPHLR